MRFVLMLLFVLSMTVGVYAQKDEQDTGFSECNPADMTETLQEALDAIPTDEDSAAFVDGLAKLSSIVQNYQVTCSGLAWSSEELGMQPVIGPVEIPVGNYRIRFSTQGYGIVELDVTDGSCNVGMGSRIVFNVMEGQASPPGAQKVLESEGCTALMTLSNTRQSWELSLEQLSDGSQFACCINAWASYMHYEAKPMLHGCVWLGAISIPRLYMPDVLPSRN